MHFNKLFLFATIFLALLFLSSFVSAKYYTLEKADVAIFIDDNSNVWVDEMITFNFYGSFTYAYRDIPKGSWEISDIYVLDENENDLQFELSNNGNNTRITWHYNANDVVRTFIIGYKLKYALNVYNDVAELNWKLWGSSWDLPLKEIVGNIYLPRKVNDPKEVYTWGHPEVNGKIGLLDNNTVFIQAFDIRSNQFVEVRTVFPRDLITDPKNGIIYSGNGLQKIIDEENDIYNREHPKPIYSIILLIVSLGILFATFFILKNKYSKQNKIQDIYFRDVPYNYSPAIIPYLYNSVPDTKYISAEILNLCLKKKLSIEIVDSKNVFSKTDYKFIIKDSKNNGLSESEVVLFDFIKDAAKYGYKDYLIFKKQVGDNTPNELLLSELKTYLKKNNLETEKLLKNWDSAVKDDVKEIGLSAKPTGTIIFAIVWVLLSFITMYLSIYFKSIYPGIIIILSGFPFLVFAKYLVKRNDLALEHYTKWSLLKKYLNDFSDFRNKDVQDIKLWEKYLVYAIPLGCAKKVQKNMQLVFEGNEKAIHSGIFVGSQINSYSDIVSATDSFSSAFSSAVSTSGSSGFGGGGGSGGGGGGGGAG